ncbi:MAG: hypothetical protein ABMA13_04745 [Chthoniobacteraceae bacterium]
MKSILISLALALAVAPSLAAPAKQANDDSMWVAQVACGTKDDGHLPTVRDFHNALLKHGVDHTYIEIEGLDHNQKQMIATFKAVWFDYHVESLRRAAAEQ